MTLRASVRVEGDFACANGMWTVQAVLPQGFWIQQVLTGALHLTPGAYAVPAPDSTYVERWKWHSTLKQARCSTARP